MMFLLNFYLVLTLGETVRNVTFWKSKNDKFTETNISTHLNNTKKKMQNTLYDQKYLKKLNAKIFLEFLRKCKTNYFLYFGYSKYMHT